MYKVYIRLDEEYNIIEIGSSAFLEDATGWIEVDEGYGDKYHHAQGHYFPLSIITEVGRYRYKYINNEIVQIN